MHANCGVVANRTVMNVCWMLLAYRMQSAQIRTSIKMEQASGVCPSWLFRTIAIEGESILLRKGVCIRGREFLLVKHIIAYLRFN